MDSGLLESRIADTASICEKTGAPKFIGFLTPEEAAVAERVLKSGSCRHDLFGGYDRAERVMLACLPEWCDSVQYPVSAVTLSFRKCDKLTHRDFLGSLMSLGITRESVGDILIEDGRAVVFISNDVLKYVKTQLVKVAGSGVTVSDGFETPLPGAGVMVSLSDTVASSRLDCVICALCSFSRGEASELIESGRISINSVCCEKPTRTVVNGDKITVRGKGKFTVTSLDERSRKGRIILKYEKYV